MRIIKKKIVISLIILIFGSLFSNNSFLTLQEVNQDNFDYKLYYSDKLTPELVFKWKFNKFITTGFRDNVLTDFPISVGSIVELKILKNLNTYNVREYPNYNDPNKYFQLKIDGTIFPLSQGGWTIKYFFKSDMIPYTKTDEQGQIIQYDSVVYESLHFLYASKMIYENTTELNKFEFDKEFPQRSTSITGEKVTISDTKREIHVEKSTGIVTSFKSKFTESFPTNDRFTVDIEYEYFTEEDSVITNVMEGILVLIIMGSVGALAGLLVAIIIRRK